MTQRIAVFPADRHSLYKEHGYSAAIRSGDLLFVSGQVGSHTDGTPEPDFQKQVRIVTSSTHFVCIFLLDNISVDATCKVMNDINPPLSLILWIRSQVK